MTTYTVEIEALDKRWMLDLDEKTHAVEMIHYVRESSDLKWQLLDSELWNMEVDGMRLVDLLGDMARDVPGPDDAREYFLGDMQ